MNEQALESLRKEIVSCSKCPVRKECKAPVPFYGNFNSDLLFLGRNPGLCCSSRTRISFNGKFEMIGPIIRKKKKGYSESVNLDTLKIENKNIVNYFSNGSTDDWWNLKWKGGSGYFTSDHRLVSGGSLLKVKDLNVGDFLDGVDWVLGETAEQILLGTLLGDSNIFNGRNDKKSNCYVSFMQGIKQLDYLNWKTYFFEPLLIKKRRKKALKGDFVYFYDTRESRCFNKFKDIKSGDFIGKMGPAAYAVWYQDDGTLAKSGNCRIGMNKLGRDFAVFVVQDLNKKLGITPTITKSTKVEGNYLRTVLSFSKRDSIVFLKWIADYSFLRYKNPFSTVKDSFVDVERKVVSRSIRIDRKIRKIDSNGTGKGMYCIEVEGNHTFLLNGGVISGNSEDEQNIPFVGPAGQLLDSFIYSIGKNTSDILKHNILCCFTSIPKFNRKPTPLEIMKCIDYTYRLIDIVKPKLIISLGMDALEWVTDSKESPNKIHGQFLPYKKDPSIKVFVLNHPGYLCRKPMLRSQYTDDARELRKYLSTLNKVVSSV